MERQHIYLIPGHFGSVDLGAMACWGPTHDALKGHLAKAGWAAELHLVQESSEEGEELHLRALTSFKLLQAL